MLKEQEQHVKLIDIICYPTPGFKYSQFKSLKVI